LNAGVGYRFLKDRRAELRLSVFDLLNQNNSIARNVTETYVEDVQTVVLQQFVMLTFTYNIRHFRK
jgi:vacuolar-type H+-ATPase subunit D/Vma8